MNTLVICLRNAGLFVAIRSRRYDEKGRGRLGTVIHGAEAVGFFCRACRFRNFSFDVSMNRLGRHSTV